MIRPPPPPPPSHPPPSIASFSASKTTSKNVGMASHSRLAKNCFSFREKKSTHIQIMYLHIPRYLLTDCKIKYTTLRLVYTDVCTYLLSCKYRETNQAGNSPALPILQTKGLNTNRDDCPTQKAKKSRQIQRNSVLCEANESIFIVLVIVSILVNTSHLMRRLRI